jgi:hypothetical protein
VLFEAPKREITAVAVAADGTIYAASVGDKSHNPLPPLPVQGVGSVTSPSFSRARCRRPTPAPPCPKAARFTRLSRAQAPRKLWAGKDEIVYALAAQPDGLLALTGNRGRVFRIHDDGSYADVAHLEAQQGLSMAAVQDAEGMGGVLIGTGNTGKLVLLGRSEKHEYASDVLDAGALARFGRVEVEPGSAGYELLTRTGNVEQPVRGWSDWQPLKDGAVASPARPLPAVEGRAARDGLGGRRGRQLPARECRAGGGRPGGCARRALQSAGADGPAADGQHCFPLPASRSHC